MGDLRGGSIFSAFVRVLNRILFDVVKGLMMPDTVAQIMFHERNEQITDYDSVQYQGFRPVVKGEV